MPRPHKPTTTQSRIVYLGSDTTDHTAIFAISGIRWEYFLSPSDLHTTSHLVHKISTGKALAFAKSRAVRSQKLELRENVETPEQAARVAATPQ